MRVLRRIAILAACVAASTPLAAQGGTAPRKAVVILLDGIPADVIERVATPHLDSIAAQGAYARASVGGALGGPTQTPTISAPGYMSLLTGTWANKHNVWGNSNQRPDYAFWNLFRIVETADTTRRTALFSTWTDNRTVLIGLGKPEAGAFAIDHVVDGLELDTLAFPHDPEKRYVAAIDDRVTAEAAAHIAAAGPDFTWVYLQHSDDAGHAFGDAEGFYAAVRDADARVGRIWAAVQRRQAMGEDWMIVVTTDHGRDARTGRGHGGQGARERQTWIVLNRRDVDARVASGVATIVDIAPTVLQFVGLTAPEPVRAAMDGVTLLRQP